MWSAKTRDFLVRERLYIWLLIFVVSLTLAGFFTEEAPEAKKDGKPVGSLLKNKVVTKEVLIFSFAAVFAIALGLFLDLLLVIIKKEGGILIFPTLSQEGPAWGIWDVCRVAILFLWFGYMFALIEGSLARVFPILKSDNLRALLNTTLTDLLVILFVIYFAVYRCGKKIRELGLSLKNFLRNIFYGLAGYLAALPVLAASVIFVIWLTGALKYEPPMQPVLEFFLEEKKLGMLTYLSIFVAVFGPVAEELFFRAFMYRAIRARFGYRPALISTSAIFAVLHASVIGFLPIMMLGMLLTYLFEKTGTIVASCAVHIFHNSVMVAAVFIMKGLMQ